MQAVTASGRSARPEPSGPTTRRLPRVPPALWWWVTAGTLLLVALGVERKITWYLAVDQYGYLTFASDLARGRVFHDWPPLRALEGALPPHTDMLAQSYVYDHGRLYCRYAPGFPMLLAGWTTLFGVDGAHFLNPFLFLVLLALLLAFQRRLFHSRWRASAGSVLVVLFPTLIQFWALTPLRDLATHVAGFSALLLLLPAGARRLRASRAAAAGLAAGFAGSIRPDAVLYLLPAVLLATARWYREGTRLGTIARGLGAGALGVTLGLSPSLAYNWMATGNPLQPTQGMEIVPLASRVSPSAAVASAADPDGTEQGQIGYPPGAWRGGTTQAVQGGGLSLEHFRTTFPGNIALLRGAYGGPCLLIAFGGAAIALVRRRLLFLVAIPYAVVGIAFFSLWGHPDSRYLIGIHLLVPMLVVEGTLGPLDFVRRLDRGGWRRAARAAAAATGSVFLAGMATITPPPGSSALSALRFIVPGVGGVALLAAAAWPNRRLVQLAAPLLGLALVALLGVRIAAAFPVRASFQRAQMLRAREAFAELVDRGAVVITTEDVGRPAENIEYYSGVAHALYLTDLERWRLPLADAAHRFALSGMTPYLFLPASDQRLEGLLESLSAHFHVDLVADLPPDRSKEYFVAAPFHRGVRMVLYRITPADAVGGP